MVFVRERGLILAPFVPHLPVFEYLEGWFPEIKQDIAPEATGFVRRNTGLGRAQRRAQIYSR